MPTRKNHRGKKRSEEIHTLSEFLNIPSIMNRARKNELRRLGITPINNFPPYVPPSPPKNLTPQQKQRFEESIARSLEWNNTNNNLKLFANLGNSRSRMASNASDPKSLSRGSSPISFEGGRKTRKAHKKHKRHHTRKH